MERFQPLVREKLDQFRNPQSGGVAVEGVHQGDGGRATRMLQGEVDGAWAACVVAHGDDLLEPQGSPRPLPDHRAVARSCKAHPPACRMRRSPESLSRPFCDRPTPNAEANSQINFIGNVEGRDIFLDHADVLVCEGFTGNVILKLAESLHGIIDRQKIKNEYFDRFNFEDYGGTPVLGVNKPVIIGHGISRTKAYKNMLLLAQKMISTKLLEKMASAFKA